MKLLLRIFFAVYFFIRGKPKFSKKLSEAVNLYKGEGFESFFQTIRAWDAPHEKIEKLVPKKGKILDLGSGDGLLANYLALSSKKRKVVGVELRKNRVGVSQKGLSNTRFIRGDVLENNLSLSDCVLMFHLLHHIYPKDYQEKLIRKVSKSLIKGGKLVIVEITQKPFLKYLFCFLVDAFVLPILFDKKLYDFDFRYRRPNEWGKMLSENGFSFKTMLVHRGMPFPHIIFYARKKDK